MKAMCIKQGAWRDMIGRPVQYPAPNYREIVTIEGELLAPNGSEQVYLAEYSNIVSHGGGAPARISFAKKHFVPFLDPKEKFDFRTRIKSKEKESEDA